MLNLSATGISVNLNEEIGRAQIPVVFRYLILQNQMIAKGIPGQLIDEPVILMQVIPLMCEHKIRIHLGFQALEDLFHFTTHIGEEPVTEIVDFYPCS